MSLDPSLSMALAVQAHRGIYAVLLGSGVSRSAGIPTGWEVVVDMIGRIATLTNEDASADPAGWYTKKFGKAPSYSDLLAMLAPKPAERMSLLRDYFEPTKEEAEHGQKIPTPAHHAIARLVAGGFIKVIITTNFDRLTERAIEAVGISPVVISSPDQIAGMMPLAHVKCLVIKIHGDYLDTRTRNTPDELNAYDPETNGLLDRVLSEYGLIVCGWSAEWDVARASAIMRNTRFRFSTYWLSRGKVSTAADRLIGHRQAVIVPMAGADAAFTDLDAKVQALEGRRLGDPMSPKIAVAMMKRLLADNQYRIKLNDFVIEELAMARKAIGIQAMPVSDPRPDQNSYPARVQQMEVACSKLAAIVATGVYWGDSGLDHLWRRCLESLTKDKIPAGNVYNAWSSLRYFPMNLLAYTAGIAAISRERYDVFQTVFVQSVARGDQDGESMISLISTMHCFDFEMAQCLLPRSSNGGKYKTPGSDWLVTRLPVLLHEIIGDDIDFEELYDEFDTLISLIATDMNFGFNYARYAWRGFFRRGKTPFITKMEQEVDAQGGKYPVLAAGLFGRDPQRLKKAIASVVENAARVSW